MSYHVTILRTRKGKRRLIELEEAISATRRLRGWRYVDSTTSFEFHGENGSFSLWFEDGELWTKNPDEWQLEVMICLATQLDARVRGDELETYISPAETYQHPDDHAAIDSQAALSMKYRKKATLRRRLFRTYQFVAIALVLYAATKWLKLHLWGVSEFLCKRGLG